jgi:ribose-phosphate pyrophosphokinase
MSSSTKQTRKAVRRYGILRQVSAERRSDLLEFSKQYGCVMTTMALTQAPLRRLFERLDFAPAPKEEALGVILEQWKAAREAMVAPSRRRLAAARKSRMGDRISVHQLAEGERSYILVSGEKAAATLLGPCGINAPLSEAKNRRVAVRLRRLFDEVRRVGEPVLAEFTLIEKGRDRAAIELLAAPMSEDGKTIDSVLAAASVRSFETGASARPPKSATDSGLAIFALGSSRLLGEKVTGLLRAELSPHEVREFEDGEHKIRPLAEVRNRDVYIIYSLHGEVERTGADKLCRLLFFIGTIKDAGAARITAVVPYLCYSRKDRQTKPRDPVTTRYVAQLFEAVGVDRVMTVDVHNVAAFQNAFRCSAIALDAQAIFARYIAAEIGEQPVAVVSPDLGGEKRAELFRQRLETLLNRPITKGFMDKYRSMGKVTGETFAGDVEGRTVIVLDDLISTGGTMARTAAACRKHGSAAIWLFASHGVFSADAPANLQGASIDRIIVTDSAPLPARVDTADFKARLTIVSVAGLIAEAIRRCNTGGSIEELLEAGP